MIQAETLLSKLQEALIPETSESVEEILWQSYEPAEDPRCREKLLALEPYFRSLSPEAGDALLGLILDLSIA